MCSFKGSNVLQLRTDKSQRCNIEGKKQTSKDYVWFHVYKLKTSQKSAIFCSGKHVAHDEHKIPRKVFPLQKEGHTWRIPEGFWDVVMFCLSAWVLNSVVFIIPKLYVYVFIYSFVFCYILQCFKSFLILADLEKVIF